MAINLRCQCQSESKLTAKVCKRCGRPFPKKGRTYKVTVTHRKKKQTGTFTNLELARETESKWKLEIARGEFGVSRKKVSPALSELWATYLPWAKENKKSWKDDQNRYENHLRPAFAKKRLDKISQFDVEKLVLTMKKGTSARGRSYAPANIKHVLVLLSRLYSLANQWGIYTGENPCSRVKKPVLNNQVTEFLSPEELTNLIVTLDSWRDKQAAGFVRFLLHTGLRRGELFALKWDDIDLETKNVIIRDPKGGKLDQTLPLSDKAIDCLKSLPKDDSDYVFPGKNGGQRVDFKKPWIGIRKAAGLPKNFRLHGLRHHFNTFNGS